jgi:AcrR family transcriptional regulator
MSGETARSPALGAVTGHACRHEASPPGRKQVTHQRILDAALRCFTERGYRATTIEQIADHAGTAVPTFYRHFESKGHLLYPLLHHLEAAVATTLRALDRLDVSRLATVRRWLDDYMATWQRVHRLCDAHWEAMSLDSAYAERAMCDVLEFASIMENVLAAMSERARARFKIKMGLLLMLLDRMASCVAVERSASRAEEVLSEFSKMLWSVLNENPEPEKAARS